MPNRQMLSLPATSTIAQIGVIAAEITKALQDGGDVRLATESVVKTDVSVIQVLVAAQRLAQANGRKLEISLPPGGAVTDLIARLGLHHAATDRPQVADCIWSGNDKN